MDGEKVKTPKSYKLSDYTLRQIEELAEMLPAESATNVLEIVVAEAHTRLMAEKPLIGMQSQLAGLWKLFEKHPHYDTYVSGECTIMYNSSYRARWQGRKGILNCAVLEYDGEIYKTPYTTGQLKELAGSEKFFVP